MKWAITILGANALLMGTAVAQDNVEMAKDTAPETAAAEAIEAIGAEAVVPMTATPAVQAATMDILPAGTAIVLTMDQALATDKRERIKGEPKPPKGKRRITNMGDTFNMTVAEDVVTSSTVVIPKGTRGVGEVTMVTGRGGFGKSGKIEFKLNYLELNGGQIAMEGTHLQKGKGRGGAAVAGTIIAGVVAGAFIKGSEADVTLMSEWNFSTAEDFEFKVDNSAAAEVLADAAADAIAATGAMDDDVADVVADPAADSVEVAREMDNDAPEEAMPTADVVADPAADGDTVDAEEEAPADT